MIYIPYGAEWELAMMKQTKKELVESGSGNLSRGRL